MLLHPALAIALALPLQTSEPGGPARLVTVDLAGTGLAPIHLTGRFDVAGIVPGTQRVELVARDDDLVRLNEEGIPYRIERDDMTAWFQSRFEAPDGPPSQGAGLSPAFGAGSLGGFYSFAEVESVLDQITALNPAIVSAKVSIGQTIEGREIWAVKISDNVGVDENEPETRFDAMHHAREPQSMQTLIWFMLCLVENYGSDPLTTYLVNEREMWFIPVVNPDGYVYNETIAPGGGGLWRKNRRENGDGTLGVDLNRNYSFNWGFDNLGSSPTTSSEVYRGTGPASEPEVAAMEAFISSRHFETSLSCHTYSDLWLYPLGYVAQPPANDPEYAEVSALATEVNGYPYGPAGALLYLTNGTTDDYDHGAHGILAWTPEIGNDSDNFWPPTSRIVPLAQENELALARTALAAGAYLRIESVTLDDLGDGDGFLEPGETFEVQVGIRNSGDGSSATLADVALASGPELNVTVSPTTAAAPGRFSSSATAPGALAFTVDPGATLGSPAVLTVSLTYEGYTGVFEEELLIGEIAPFLADDVETDLGWIVGLPGDTATTGLWEFGDPLGTTNGGLPSNPEDDASPAGVACFATGNGSTSAGGDDVDNGHTTLISPRLQLGDVLEPVVSYSRWFADYTTPDDLFEVSLSNDDGATWVVAESVSTTAAQWTPVELRVSDFVVPTDLVRLRFVAADDPNNSIVEGGVDELSVRYVRDDTRPRFNVYGRADIGTPIGLNVAGEAGVPWSIYASFGTANVNLAFLIGPLLLHPGQGFGKVTSGLVPAGGLAQVQLQVPNNANLVGLTVYLQAITVNGSEIRTSNRGEFTIE